jgi:hypothetical protein
MFAHQSPILQIMMLGQQLIESIHFLRRNGLHHQMNENLLFTSRGLAKAGKSSFHAP